MKDIKAYRNGTYDAEELITSIEYDLLDDISDSKIIKTKETFRAYIFDYNLDIEVPKGSYFILYDGLAYPFDTPFYPSDEETGATTQEFPENWEDILFYIEGFGR